MGWVGQQDTTQQLSLRFATKEEAIAYAEKHGFEVEYAEPKTRRVQPKSYADNFSFSKITT